MGVRTPLIAGNWKMNLDSQESVNLVKTLKKGITGDEGVDILVSPTFVNLTSVKLAIGDSGILLAAQNMYYEKNGAYTGEISGHMLLDVGCTHVILGHSERRSIFKETSELIDLKAKAAVETGLKPIVCIGETIEEREAGNAFDVIRDQLNKSLKNFKNAGKLPASTVLAYEPVWAIGTGKTASPEQAQEIHLFIRQWITDNFDPETASQIRILYGGSVKGSNASELMGKPDIDGALVGGASLSAEAFLPIIKYKRN